MNIKTARLEWFSYDMGMYNDRTL